MTHVWRRNTVTYTYWQNTAAVPPSNGIHSGPSVIFAGNQQGQNSGPLYYPPGQWHDIDLLPLGVHHMANSAVLAGHLIITESSPGSIDDLVVTVRAPGSTFNWQNYQMQAMAALNGDGARGSQGARVSLVDGRFQLFWQGFSAGVPFNAANGSGFLVSLWLEEWSMDEGLAPAPAPAPAVIYVPPEGTTIRFEQGVG